MFTDAETTALTTLIAGFDNRFDNDRPARASWKRAANAEGWAFEAAVGAVQRFYSRPIAADESLPRIAPGHITTLIRQGRPGGSGPAPAQQVLATFGHAALTVGRPSTAEHRAEVRAEVAAKLEQQLGRPSRIKAREPWHDGPVVRDLDDRAIEAGVAQVRQLLSGPRAAKRAADSAVAAP